MFFPLTVCAGFDSNALRLFASIVQWIGHDPSKVVIGVRVPIEVLFCPDSSMDRTLDYGSRDRSSNLFRGTIYNKCQVGRAVIGAVLQKLLGWFDSNT